MIKEHVPWHAKDIVSESNQLCLSHNWVHKLQKSNQFLYQKWSKYWIQWWFLNQTHECRDCFSFPWKLRSTPSPVQSVMAGQGCPEVGYPSKARRVKCRAHQGSISRGSKLLTTRFNCLFFLKKYIFKNINIYIFIKGSLGEKLPCYGLLKCQGKS